ncbi:MAG: hypothetical protein H6651_04205 [Ardenticatenales bacterium]|nr:hypothetical protein [Ardenticatenales bacterium]
MGKDRRLKMRCGRWSYPATHTGLARAFALMVTLADLPTVAHEPASVQRRLATGQLRWVSRLTERRHRPDHIQG